MVNPSRTFLISPSIRCVKMYDVQIIVLDVQARITVATIALSEPPFGHTIVDG